MKRVAASVAMAATVFLGACSLFLDACSKGEAANASPGPPSPASPAASASSPGGPSCEHAACGPTFYVDAVPPDDCIAGASCRLTLKLVALGDFHVNDEYPYRFKAEEAPGIVFSGTDAAGKGVFSKPAGDWSKTGAQSGAMAVTFTPSAKGDTAISGTFKLSVCSAQNCLLEQRQVSARVAAR